MNKDNLLNTPDNAVYPPVVAFYANLQSPPLGGETVKGLRTAVKGKPLIYAFKYNDSSEWGYVGSTTEPEIRFYNHLVTERDSNLHLQNAFKKYGLPLRERI